MKDEFQKVLNRVRDMAERQEDLDVLMKDICDLLYDKIDHYGWVGFYLVGVPNELVLGPFTGDDTEHTNIAFGTGVCGRSAEERKTLVIQDVSEESNYLACSLSVRSEIVVPVISNGNVVGVLDIDSDEKGPFTGDDIELLESIVDIVGERST
ncbi:MAG: GAF domain-containing protein [Thermoplasmata archaeon]